MENEEEEHIEYEIKNVDHLGLIAGICEEIGLVEYIDKKTLSNERRILSVGQGVKALILMNLGYIERTLYLAPEFYRDKPVSLLIGEGIEAEHINKDSLSSILDALYSYGVKDLFMELSFKIHSYF